MQYSALASPIVYPQLPKNIDSDDIETFFAVSQQDKEWVKSLTYSGDTRIAFLCLLGGFQSLGYFPDLSDLSPCVIKHIAEAADAAPPSIVTTQQTDTVQTSSKDSALSRRICLK